MCLPSRLQTVGGPVAGPQSGLSLLVEAILQVPRTIT